MATRQEVTFVIRARDLTRTAFGRVRQSVNRLGRSLASLAGILGAGALIAGFNNATRAVKELDNAVVRTGIDSERLAALSETASSFGTNQEQFIQFLDQIKIRRDEALEGNAELEQSFAALGVSFQQLERGDIEEILLGIANATRSSGVKEFARELNQIGGEVGLRLAPFLERGAEGINEAARSLEQAGAFDDAQEQAQQARELQVQSAELQRQLQIFLLQTLPAITELTKAINALVAFGKEPGLETAQRARGVVDAVPGLSQLAAGTEALGVGTAAFDAQQSLNTMIEKLTIIAENSQNEIVSEFNRQRAGGGF